MSKARSMRRQADNNPPPAIMVAVSQDEIRKMKHEAFLRGAQAEQEAQTEAIATMANIMAIRAEMVSMVSVAVGWTQAAGTSKRLADLLSAATDHKGQTLADALETTVFQWYRLAQPVYEADGQRADFAERIAFYGRFVKAMRETAAELPGAEKELRQLVSDCQGDHWIDRLAETAFALPKHGPPVGMQPHRRLVWDTWRKMERDNAGLSRPRARKMMIDLWIDSRDPVEREAARYLQDDENAGRLYRNLKRDAERAKA
jgi:hypothetical protein